MLAHHCTVCSASLKGAYRSSGYILAGLSLEPHEVIASSSHAGTHITAVVTKPFHAAIDYFTHGLALYQFGAS